MKNHIQFNLGELEQHLWNTMLETFQQAMVEILSTLDLYLMAKRDAKRYEYKDIKGRDYVTMFGSIRIDRRYYWDNQAKEWVFLLDRALDFETKEQVSACLKELVVLWATKGPSYRDVRDRLKDLYGYQIISHEKIRQVLIQASETLRGTMEEKPVKKRVKTLFIEADGFWTGAQYRGRRKRRKRETHLVVVHEGWEKRQGRGKKADYRLKNPMYITVIAGCEEGIWEQTQLRLLQRYEDLSQIQFVINGDFAPWIRTGAKYFRNAVYQCDRFHLKREVKRMLGNSKKYLSPAFKQIDQNNPDGLFETIAKAAEEATDLERKLDLLGFKVKLQKYKDALSDYRQNLKDQGVEVFPTWRGMGAAESNVDRFKLRTAKRGRSWSKRGLEAILHMLGLLYENILHDSIKQLDVLLDAPDTKEFIATSAGQIAKTVGRKAIGARQAGFPALNKGTQGFAKLFRDVLNPCPIQ